MASKGILSVRGLRKSWPGGLLDLVINHLDVDEGETVALTGDNGAGKTTLLRLLAGLLKADAAKISWQGRPVPSLRAGRDVTYLHQQPHMLDFSVRANVEFVLKQRGAGVGEAMEALAWSGLADKAGLSALALSLGERRRLALARVRATAAPLILLDEPTANLDLAGVAAVEEMVRGMAAAGRTVVAAFQVDGVPGGISHDRELRMKDGRLVGDGG